MPSSVKTIQWGGEQIKTIKIYPTLPSTNSCGKELVIDGCSSGTVVWALHQTAGRGRRGRNWGADQSSLTFSVLWATPADFPTEILPLTVGLGLVQSLIALVPELKVKWPNDLWFKDRKLGGILAESTQQGGQKWVILGVGLNVNRPSVFFGKEAISIQEITKYPWPRLGILHLALLGMERGIALAQGQGTELSGLFRQYGNFLDRTITIVRGEERWMAWAKEVLPDGRLLIEDAQGERALVPDEISVRFC